MQKLAQGRRDEVLDVLSARVNFERTGVSLYDSVIAKIERGAEPRYQKMLRTLRKHRDEEKEHEEWLEAQIRGLGGDPHAKTAMARLEEEESQGVQSVILDGHTQVPHLIHALLTAELADNAGWDLLVKLADDTGDREAKKEFAKRMAAEVKHLAYLREAMKRSAETEVLHQKRSMPSRPASALSRMVKPLGATGVALLGFIVAAGAATWMMRRSQGRPMSTPLAD